MKKKWWLALLSWLFIGLTFGTSVQAETRVPSYYREVLTYLSDHYDDILNRTQELNPKYVTPMYLAQGDIKELNYALCDINKDGVPELFVGDKWARAIYTYARKDVHLIAGYETTYITNKGGISIYEDGSIWGWMSFAVDSQSVYRLAFNKEKTALKKVETYQFDGRTYKNEQTGQEFTPDDFKRKTTPKAKIVDEGQLDWHSLKQLDVVYTDQTPHRKAKGKAQNSVVKEIVAAAKKKEKNNKTSQKEPKADKSADNLKGYLHQLRLADKRYATYLEELMKKGMPSSQTIEKADRHLGKTHPVISALYKKFDEGMAAYREDPLDVEIVREVYSDSFVLEKMLLPELKAADQRALDQLRGWSAAVVLEAYQDQSPQFRFFKKQGLEYSDFQQEMTDVKNLSDERFDQVNRLAIHTGIAAEAYTMQVNFPNFVKDVPFKGDWFSYIIHPTSQDIGSTRYQAIHPENGQVYQGIPLTSEEPKPVDPVDYSQRYGVKLTNHYPKGHVETNKK